MSVFKPTQANIQKAAKLIKKGELVAFPTETVYGLGANALSDSAVRKIFKAKGRPSDNPLIVHIATMKELEMVAREVTPVARKLMKKFWPGPLTFVLQKTSDVPDSVTAGGKTVAVRMPHNTIALDLIKAAGCPVAAPSANLAGKPSPTTARHVEEDFGNTIGMILDGGTTRHGLESTVIDATGKKVEILRSGAVTAEMLAKILGYKPKIVKHEKGSIRSPGMKYRHYAPTVDLILVAAPERKKMIAQVEHLIGKYHRQGLRVGVLTSLEHRKFYQTADQVVVCGSLKNLTTVARNLYDSLRQFKPEKADVIVSEHFGSIGSKGIGHAIFDRLSRAAAKIV